jgi:hypothetical protein
VRCAPGTGRVCGAGVDGLIDGEGRASEVCCNCAGSATGTGSIVSRVGFDTSGTGSSDATGAGGSDFASAALALAAAHGSLGIVGAGSGAATGSSSHVGGCAVVGSSQPVGSSASSDSGSGGETRSVVGAAMGGEVTGGGAVAEDGVAAGGAGVAAATEGVVGFSTGLRKM